MVLKYSLRIREFLFATTLTAVSAFSGLAQDTPPTNDSYAGKNVVLTRSGRQIEYQKTGQGQWLKADKGQELKTEDGFRTGRRSRATLQFSDLSVLKVNQYTTLSIKPPNKPEEADRKRLLDLKAGAAYFLNRDKPASIDFQTPTASGAIRGTEFHLLVETDGTTQITMFDGDVDMTNEFGSLQLTAGEQGTVAPGQAPVKTAVINATNIIQWALYYPAILDLDDLELDQATATALEDSLNAYLTGDLLQALALFPETRDPQSNRERIYLSALVLSVGGVEEAIGLLQPVLDDANADAVTKRLTAAIQKLVTAVKYEIWDRDESLNLTTEWMAESYYQQSRSQLPQALIAAQNAVEESSDFGFAQIRVAEMQFSFGRVDDAVESLDRGVLLSPRNAQALSLRGYLLAAENKIQDAEQQFQEAVDTDGGLGNAWLGLGLVKIKQGRDEEGRQDMQTAAVQEPNRAVFRSYLGKAFSNVNDNDRASEELALARKLDPNDPTSWLYTALLNQQMNRINQAVTNLEKSKALNNNRSVYRSQQLLDQDQAVRSANLSKIYRDAGMIDVSTREGSKAVQSDYLNASAHQFLGSSYFALTDPNRINLRFETPWLAEQLMANLLSPVGAGGLSQNISQQEYSKLLEEDGFSYLSASGYTSNGDWKTDNSQSGTFKDYSYSLDFGYVKRNGWRPNNDLESYNVLGKFKFQLTPKDTLFLQVQYFDAESGDTSQYYDQDMANTVLRAKENLEPMVFAGLNHKWSEKQTTLVLLGSTDNILRRSNPGNVSFHKTDLPGTFFDKFETKITDEQNYRSDTTFYNANVQHIIKGNRITTVLGGRYQYGDIEIDGTLNTGIRGTSLKDDFDSEFYRFSIFAYNYWEVSDNFQINFGVTFDKIKYPVNVDILPATDDTTKDDQISPKIGFVYTPMENLTLRGAYTQSLGGLFFDNSVRLEPTQLAGFTQAFRSLITGSFGGLIAGSEFETYGLGLDYVFPTKTYFGVEAEILNQDGDRQLPVLDDTVFALTAGDMENDLDYQEENLRFNLYQLLGNNWTLGARHTISRSDLNSEIAEIGADEDYKSILHQTDLFALYNHKSGFFSIGEAIYRTQSNQDDLSARKGDEFWHFNLFGGYRFNNRHAEIRLGLMNIFDQDYQLSPLNFYQELPRERTFAARFAFNF